MADFTPTFDNYTSVKPFKYWVQTVIPLVYDDSLSYYELLAKVVDYLNKVIEDNKTMIDNIDSLLEAYTQLQAFVNDYFDNLDVQEEINNKLDSMASDGALSELLQPFFDSIENDIGIQNDKLYRLEARVNELAELPEGSTTGDAELIDIRTGGDNVNYSSAGNSVRGQFDDFINYKNFAFDKSFTPVNWFTNFDDGGINDNGTSVADNTRFRTQWVPPTAVEFEYEVPNTIEWRIHYYRTSSALYPIKHTSWQSGTITDFIPYPYFRIEFRSAIDPTSPINKSQFIDLIKIKRKYYKVNEAYDLVMRNFITKNITNDIKWNQGTIYSGLPAESMYRIYTDFIDGRDTQYFIDLEQNYGMAVIYYSDKDNTKWVRNNPNTITQGSRVTEKGYWFRILYGYKTTGVEEITPQSDKHITITEYYDKRSIDWSGLKVSLLGDSISTFPNYIPNGNVTYYTGSNNNVTSVTDMWWYKAITKMGGTPHIIDAWSGSCVARGVRQPIATNSYKAMSEPDRCQNLHSYVMGSAGDYDIIVTEDNINNIRISPFANFTPQIGDYLKEDAPDIIIVTGGANDYTYNAPMGTWNGTTELDTNVFNSFREAYANMLNLIHEKYPNALVITAKPFFCIRPTRPKQQININDIGIAYKEYVDAIVEISDAMASPIIDLFTAGFNRFNYYPTFANDSSTIPTHPNAIGQAVIGDNVTEQLNDICRGYIKWLKR